MKHLTLVTCLILLTSNSCFAHMYLEKEYQKQWCSLNSGKTEYILADKTRIDCLTNEYAIEFDFANKWAESIGQSLYYALCTGKKPGVVLIMENEAKDLKYLKRLKEVSAKYNIKVWTMKPDEMPATRNCQNQNPI